MIDHEKLQKGHVWGYVAGIVLVLAVVGWNLSPAKRSVRYRSRLPLRRGKCRSIKSAAKFRSMPNPSAAKRWD